MAFPPNFLDELRNRITLSELVGRRVVLKRKGREHAGLCPFHNEKTPSFWVNDQKAFFHCFGCGAHGDAIGFAMRIDNLSFPEAVERLAGEAGLEVPETTPHERERAKAVATLHQVTETATIWFEQQLRMPGGKPGLDYLRGRGLGEDTITRFRLGFAPDNREALQAALRRTGATDRQLVDTGLVIQPEDGGRAPYDRFRGRVMFPIHDRRGRIIAFGGRIIGAGEPKYLNSPETELFHKGDNLYCLHLAREAAAKGRPVIVAEGYMDVIALHVAGFDGAVAPLGTALTESQIALLWRYADEPYLCFDGDNAGRRAATRAAERALPLLKPGKSLRFVTLPPSHDPDSLIRDHGPAAFEACLKQARPLVDIVWDLETAGQPMDTPERSASVAAALQQRAASIGDPIVRGYYQDALRKRLWELRRSGNGAGGGRRPARGDPRVRRSPAPGGRSRFDAGPPAWFPDGAALRVAAQDLDVGRRERVLLGAILARPAWLHDLAEEIAALPLSRSDLDRLRTILLDVAGMALAPDDTPGDTLEAAEMRIVTGRATAAGLAAVLEALRHEAERWLGTADPEAALGQWRHIADRHRATVTDAADRRAAAADLADKSVEDIELPLARIERMLRRSGTED
ncbi:DNA primase [Vineibacter terrae]|uniref:DNA primase n=1 Tax=Vineibacter terrae TaxID=2586908 RepID=A0A5C8P7B1_9HYPH|nr:DNA primase [Vineibacter terrae]TXL69515.1 DNA primase [Vineibacter terrae]